MAGWLVSAEASHPELLLNYYLHVTLERKRLVRSWVNDGERLGIGGGGGHERNDIYHRLCSHVAFIDLGEGNK